MAPNPTETATAVGESAGRAVGAAGETAGRMLGAAGETAGSALDDARQFAEKAAARTREEAEDIYAEARVEAGKDSGRDAAVYVGIAATAALGVVELPLAAAAGAAYAIFRRRRNPR